MKHKKKLDKLDRDILRLLQEDGRMPFSEIARRLNASETTVRFRYKRLIESGVIRRIIAVVDPRKVGLSQSAVFMLKFNPAKIDDALKALKKIKELYFIYQLSGEYDATAVALVPGVDELKKLVTKVKNTEGVKEVYVAMTLGVVKSDLKYVLLD